MRSRISGNVRRARLFAVGIAAALAAVAVAPSAASAAYRDEVVADGPAAYWRLGETTGTTAASEVGGQSGTYIGGVTLGQPGALAGDPNPAASFDGVNDYVAVPPSAALDATAGVTVELWAKRTKSASYQVLLGKPGDGQSRFESYALWFDTSNRVQAYFGNGSTYVSVAWATAIDTSWHHLVATYDNATARLYVDGTLRASQASTVQLTPNAKPLNMGRSNGGSYFMGGLLDEVAVYRTALSAARVGAHHSSASADAAAPVISLTQPANGSTTSDSTPAFSGVAGTLAGDLAAVTVRVYPGSTATGTPAQTLSATRAADGSYSVDGTPALVDGQYTARAEQSDGAGNLGLSAPTTFTVNVAGPDVTPPVVTLTQPANGSTTSDSTPGFSGVAGTLAGDLAAVTVRVYQGSSATGTPAQTLSTTRAAGGSYSVDASPALVNGVYTSRAEQSDSAGNTGSSAPTTFTVNAAGADVTPPVVTLTQPANGSTTNDTTPTFAGSGGVAAGDSTTVTVNVYAGSSATGTPVQTLAATRSIGGAYQIDASPPLAQGVYTGRAEQSDTAGNVGLSAPTTLTVDTSAPVISLTQPAQGATVTTATPTFAGIAGLTTGDSTAVTVKIYAGTGVGGAVAQTLTTTRLAGGSYSVAAAGSLANGTYTARAEQTDAAGNNGLSGANTFTVAVATGSDPVLIGAGDIADCGQDDYDDETAQLLAENPTATVFTLGDNEYPGGSQSTFDCFDEFWGQHKSRIRPVVGDHDIDSEGPGPAAYVNYFQQQLAPFGPTATDPTKMYYSYDLGPWHVVALNAVCFYYTPGCDPAAQEQWFRDDLAAHPNQCTVALMHAPRFSSGSIHGNNTDMQGLWSAAYDGGVELVLSGDDHLYERFGPMNAAGNADAQFGVRQFVVGTGGYSLYPFGTTQPNSQLRYNANYGLIKLTLHAGSYDWQLVPISGTSPDSGTATCHGTPGQPGGGTPGAPTVRSSASATANHGATSLTINRPSGVVSGDLLVAAVSHQSGSVRNIAPPAGWTAIANADATDGTNARIRGWYKLAGASEPASYIFTLTGGSGQALAGGMMAVTGASSTSPINAAASQATSSNLITLTAPSITTTLPSTLLVYAGAVNTPLTFTPPAMMMEHWDVRTSGSYNVSTAAAAGGFAGPGPTGTRAATLSTTARGAAILVAVAPAA